MPKKCKCKNKRKRKSKCNKINQKGGFGPVKTGIPSIDMSGNLGVILENSLNAAMKIFYTPGGNFLMKDFINLGEDSWSLFKEVISDLGVD